MYKLGLLLLLVTAVAALKKSAKQVSGNDGDKQSKILELFTDVGTEDYGHEHKPFPYSDPQLFTDTEVVKNFTTYWEEGFLDKHGVFTPYCTRTLRDTQSLYKLLYSAKNFETFHKVAKWAKEEINHKMYIHAVIGAILNREDTSAVIIPPIFEILPNYFVPATVINQAYRAKLNGVESRKFVVNNTGWEWSWHNGWGMVSPLIVHQEDKKNYDVESILSYYREDVSRLDFWIKSIDLFGGGFPVVADHIPVIERHGEISYTFIAAVLTRYNLERYAVNLPPVRPINLNEPIKAGYDSQISGLFGRSIPGRPDNVVPRHIDPEGVEMFEMLADRFLEFAKTHTLRNFTGDSVMHHYEGNEALDVFGMKLYTGDFKMYPSLYFNLLALVDGLVTSSNRVEYSTGTLMDSFTMMRDPVYYQILAYFNRLARIFQFHLKPYTKQELAFPEVQITNVDITKLETYFEYFDFDISNAVHGTGKYIASQFRLNHKPFSFNVKINSDKETYGTLRIFIGPAYDSKNVEIHHDKLRESFSLIDSFVVKLNKGENVVKRSPGHEHSAPELLQFEDIYQIINKESYKVPMQCHYSDNLVLPKGSSSGKPFKFYFVVYPYEGSGEPIVEKHENCFTTSFFEDSTHSALFPVDRLWEKTDFELHNHKIVQAKIYHSDIQSSSS